MEPDHIRYETGTDNRRDFLYTQISHTPVPQRDHILQVAKEQLGNNPWIPTPPHGNWKTASVPSQPGTLERQTGVHGYITGSQGETVHGGTLVPGTGRRTTTLRP